MTFDLSILLDSQKPVASLDNLQIVGLPPFYLYNSLVLKIRFIQLLAGVPTFIPTSGRTLQAVLGPNPPTGTYYTQQNTWTTSANLADPYFQGTIPMNTSNLQTLLNGKTSAPATFELTLTDSDGPITALSKLVSVRNTATTPGALEAPAGQTPLSLEVARSLFLTHDNQCPVIWRSSADATQGVSMDIDSNNTPHFDPL